MGYTNSSLVTYTRISPHKTALRNHRIDTISIHCYTAQVTAKQGCDYFATTDRDASSNYVVGYDGSIGLSVEEKSRSMCTSNKANDHRAVTIEVASDSKSPYAVTDAAMVSLINLCVDICKRNNIKKLVWSTNKSDRVNHRNGCNMTVHRDYASKSCPGNYLYNKHRYIADEVNKRLGVISTTTATSNLKKGEELQENLNYLGYSCGSVDGSFGTKTYNALVKFQRNNGLKVDGIYESASKAKMAYLIIKKKSSSSPVSSATTIDYSLVFNPTYYVNKYADLKAAFGTDSKKLLNHFIQCGMKEGRQGSANFNVNTYKNRYVDLQAAFGNDLPKYYQHYIQCGYAEKRQAI